MASSVTVRFAGGFSRPFEGLVRRAVVPAEVRALPSATGQRVVSAIASTGDLDRQGDRVAQDGWKLANFRKSPLIYWNHEHAAGPIARAAYVAVCPDVGLLVEAEFPPEGKSELSDSVWSLVQGGHVDGVSALFRPLRWEPLPGGGKRYLEQELQEISLTASPANPAARIRT